MGLSPVQPIQQAAGGTMHLWGASERRLKAKHAWYKAAETLKWPAKPRAEIDRYYSLALRPDAAPQFDQDWRYAAVPSEWWEAHREAARHLDLNAEPWQEAEARRLVEQHGAERFAGLDLYGLEHAGPLELRAL